MGLQRLTHVLIVTAVLVLLVVPDLLASTVSIPQAIPDPRRALHPYVRQRQQNSTTDGGLHISKNYDDVEFEDDEYLEKRHSTQFVAECDMPTTFGRFTMRSYKFASQYQQLEPLVLSNGEYYGKENVIVRVHDQCATSEVFGSFRCDCRDQLHSALGLIEKEGGLVIYLQQEGRGIGIANKIAAYQLQDHGLDTVDANLQLGFKDEHRSYESVADILQDMGVKSIRLITNNPMKITELQKLGIRINSRITLDTPTNVFNMRYMESKRDRMNHMLSKDLKTVDIKSFRPTGKKPETRAAKKQKSSTFLTDLKGGFSSIFNIRGGATPSDQKKADKDVIAKSKKSLSIPNFARGGASDLPEAENPRRGQYAFGRKSVEDAIEATRLGKPVLVVDDEDRENEGDLIMAAECATPETIGFFIRYSSGVLCISLEQDRLDAMQLPPMVANNEDPKQTAYTVSVDCALNTTTGISAADRATTLRWLADPRAKVTDFTRPGHVFPLRYKPGGVLARAGHTEASLDLARLAGLQPAGVLCEVVNDDGSMMRLDGLRHFAERFNLVLTSVQDLIAFRMETECIDV